MKGTHNLELDDLKRCWTQPDQKLDAAIHLNSRALQSPLHGKAETALRRLWIQLRFDVIAALWLGSFLADHIALPVSGCRRRGFNCASSP